MNKEGKPHYEKFINFIHDPDYGCIEFLCWKATMGSHGMLEKSLKRGRTFGGWYTKLDHLKFDIGRLRGISGYISLNPISTDLLARSNNELTTIARGQGTKEENILTYRHFLIDIDVKRPFEDMSATDAELSKTFKIRDAILNDYPEIMDHSIWGCSGNGCYIVVRIQDTSVRVGRELVKSTLRSLAEKYGKKIDKQAFVDTNTHSPVFHLGVPGTYKHKGTPTEERPSRMITVDGIGCSVDKSFSSNVEQNGFIQ